MLRKSVAILVLFLSFVATQAFALGLGRVNVESSLNQPLRVRIEVLQLGDTRLEDVNIQLASTEDFERFNIERASFLNNIRFSTESTSQGNYVVLTTSQIVREPYLSFILETRWSNGRLLSEHTILLDLPVYEEQAVPAAPVRRPISTAVNPQASGQSSTPAETNSAAAAPTASAPSVQPVLEPEVIAPVDNAVADAESIEPETNTSETNTAETSPTETSESDVEAAIDDAEPQESDEPELDDSEEADGQLAQAVDDNAEQSELDQSESADETEVTPNEDTAEIEEAEALESEVQEAEAEDELPETLTVGAADTLSDIALQVRPSTNVSMQQTMLAIQELNPDAFADGNINRLKRGEVLRIPTLEDIQAIGQRDAIAEVSRQNQQNSTVDVQPLAAPTQSASAPEESSGQLSVVTADPDADSDQGAGVTENSDTQELDQRIAELEEQLALQEEEADRARIEKEELESRLAELEEQISAAQEIIRLQDLQLAQLQQSLADAAAEAADAERIADEQAQAAEAVADEPQPTAVQAESSESFIDSLLRTIMSNSLVLIGGVVALVLLLVGVLVLRNRTNRDDEEHLDVISEDEFKGVADSAEQDEQVTDEDSLNVVSELQDYKESELDSELDAFISAGVDPSTEADDSIIDDEQAESFVDDENEVEITGTEVSLDDQDEMLAASTITEVDSQKQKDDTASFLDDLGIDLDSFEEDAFQLSDEEPTAEASKEEGDSEDLVGSESELEISIEDTEPGSEAIELTFDPESEESELVDNDEDGSEAISLESTETNDGSNTEIDAELSQGDSKDLDDLEIDSLDFEVEAPQADSPEEKEEELELETFTFESPELDSAQDNAQDSAEKGAEEPANPTTPEEEDDNLLDFDFDKSEITEETSTEELADVEAFDFDLESDSTDTVVEKSASPVNMEIDGDAEESNTEASLEDEFDFDLSDLEIDADDNTDEDIEIELSDDDFLDLDDELLSDEGSDEAAQAKPESEVEFDFDAPLSATATEATVLETTEDSSEADDDLDFLADEDAVIELPDHEGDPESLSAEEETATKLELAYAYQKMGDADGATEILQEVIAEGSESQVKEAKDLIAAIESNTE